MFVQRIFKSWYPFWYHSDFLFKLSNDYKKFKHCLDDSFGHYAKEIMAKVRKEQENETKHQAECPESLVRALMHKKYDLTDEEISDEIKTFLMAVSEFI